MFARGLWPTLGRAREVEQLLRGLRQIPIEAQIFLEIYREGMRAHEIGGALALPGPTVRTELRRARLRLELAAQAAPAPRPSALVGRETRSPRR